MTVVQALLLVIAVLTAADVGCIAGWLARRNGKSRTEAFAYGVGVATTALLLFFQALAVYA